MNPDLAAKEGQRRLRGQEIAGVDSRVGAIGNRFRGKEADLHAGEWRDADGQDAPYVQPGRSEKGTAATGFPVAAVESLRRLLPYASRS